jgi:predicted ABC-type ATPase
VAILTVIAGPNGSGKSTLTRFVAIAGADRLLDPDAIARKLNPGNPAAAAIAAAREVLKLTDAYFAEKVSFVVETTLSSPGRLTMIRKAKSCGFAVHLYFVALDSADRSITRVRSRAAQGGHFVPDEDVRRRYARSLANAAEALRMADIAHFYNNSERPARLVLEARNGVVVWRATPAPAWLPV